MSLDTASQVRLKIQDVPTLRDATYYGDGLTSSFLLPHRNVVSGSAYVPITTPFTGWSATGATFNPSGMVSFNGVMSANSAFRVTYVDSVFGDEEIGTFITAGGNVLGAAAEAVQALLFDAGKRGRWMSPDGAQYDDIGSITALFALHGILKQEQLQEAAQEMSIESWSENQEWY